jgi:hypothetical protein
VIELNQEPDRKEMLMVRKAPSFDPANHLIKVRGGADYLEVKWRLVWFRNEHPNGRVQTEVQEHDRNEGYARVRARVEFDRVVYGQVFTAVGESTGTETAKDFPDYLEKAETKAIGRALAALGYGTQFAEEFEMRNVDGSPHVVDAPVSRSRATNGYEPESMRNAPRN